MVDSRKSVFLVGLMVLLCLPSWAAAEQPDAPRKTGPPASSSPDEQASSKTPVTDAYRSLLAEGAGTSKKPGATEPTESTPAGDLPWSSFWILFGGAAVVAVVGWGIPHFREGKFGEPTIECEHLHSMKLAPKHQLSMVEVEGRRLLLGLSEGEMRVLTELDAPARGPTKAPESTAAWDQVLREAVSTPPDTDQGPASGRRTPTSLNARGGAATAKTSANRESDSVVCGLETLRKQRGKS